MFMARLAIRTANFQLSYKLIKSLRSRKIIFSIMDISEKITSSDIIWFAEASEIIESNSVGKAIPTSIETLEDSIEFALLVMKGLDEPNQLVFGIDPGPYPGLAWLADGVFIGVSQLQSTEQISNKINVDINQIYLLDHHLCHIFTALYGFANLNRDYLIFSLDGEGDGLCAKICSYQNKKLSELSKTIAGNSLAGFYGAITKFLNMKINEHEYKVMGLAAYQDKSKYNIEIIKKLKGLFKINENLEFISKGGLNYFIWYLNKNFRYERFDNIYFAFKLVPLNIYFLKSKS